MRKGKRMVVAAMNMQQKAMAFPVQLTDFAKTFDGPPVDNAKYEEARRQMMEKFRQRQIELANKAAKAEQKKAGPATPRSTPQAVRLRNSLRRRRHKRQSALIYRSRTTDFRPRRAPKSPATQSQQSCDDNPPEALKQVASRP